MVILHIGDVVGKIGRRTLARVLPELRDEHAPDFIIVNGENIAGGTGITPNTAEELLALGADCITTGNHVWSQKQALELLARERTILRPANYPPGVPGVGSGLFETRPTAAATIGVLNLCGRVFMHEMDCPFQVADAELRALTEHTRVVIVDFHAEATSEKQALARHLDGRVSAVLGTHTHVQTADECILPGGTAYITDVGMTGARESIIGVEPETVLRRFRLQMPQRFQPPERGPSFLCAVVVDVDQATGRARAITRIRRDLDG